MAINPAIDRIRKPRRAAEPISWKAWFVVGSVLTLGWFGCRTFNSWATDRALRETIDSNPDPRH